MSVVSRVLDPASAEPLMRLAEEDAPGKAEAVEEASKILSWLAYGASAAGVLGIIIVGTQLSLQLRRGDMGEGATYGRGLFIVLLASVLATTAAPLVQWFI
ncbi:hypothetical protein MMF93_25660 [Streptomyces tubbatahanensis]|uniref:Integral membrane protein n=1 Tax=Streptomyces tubbatahanensis TaxID=2923272 RepID=A0ABY3XY93_9ACTN|nr:hypothetical protein [Streptomyces tubbatahanensis]UNS99461.1 hypothetical protein MMF93_25660 [Streptomyces tubbatahanensis]